MPDLISSVMPDLIGHLLSFRAESQARPLSFRAKSRNLLLSAAVHEKRERGEGRWRGLGRG